MMWATEQKCQISDHKQVSVNTFLPSLSMDYISEVPPYIFPPLSLVLFPECSFSAIADVVFLVDGSWSVGKPNFKYIRNFISATAGAFQIGEDKTRVGVIQFSNDARSEFNLNTHLTRPSLLRAIGSLPYKGGDTRTGTLLMSFNVSAAIVLL